ncbi:hypothetical protein [Roseimicrobium sp. ORNL1]|uniref:hypothetical protein n=1 Tax=Roseimicrobium sp. ORNL1 TaxID=2711231 RepID=UPI0013E1C9A6|nr:hypothetical protein [Roseimicrobium sp. ORNL1]QIF05457.1 hypothetical protein G5S37_29480 [Roseimicrobium sp. ORNL1]
MIVLLLNAAALSTGYAADDDPLKKAEKITYYDRNGDGKVDCESHTHRGWADADWLLMDDNYDGRYEKKMSFGVKVFETEVDIPVPTGVPISKQKR